MCGALERIKNTERYWISSLSSGSQRLHCVVIDFHHMRFADKNTLFRHIRKRFSIYGMCTVSSTHKTRRWYTKKFFDEKKNVNKNVREYKLIYV